LIFVALLIGDCKAGDAPLAEAVDPPQVFGDFIAALNASPVEARAALIDSFLSTASSRGFPCLEGTRVYFIYRGNASSRVSVPGDFNGWCTGCDFMTKVDGTDLHYLVRSFEPDARLDYKFLIDGAQWILDPLNPSTVTGGFGPNSEIAMPEYVRPEEIEFHSDIPHGTIESFDLHSAVLGDSRRVQVYLPPGYAVDQSRRYPSIYVNDGGEYLSLASMNNVLDYCIARKDIEGCIAIFADPVDRNSEYPMNPSYLKMIVTELVPRIDGGFRTIDDPAKRGIMGASLGGLISFYIAYARPDVFGLCAGQSSAFHVDSNRMIDTISNGPGKDVVCYLDWGTYETAIMHSNLGMLEVLNSKGYSTTSFEYHEGHSWGNWRAHTDDILKTFF
jgi:enterochelin esterase family protein